MEEPQASGCSPGCSPYATSRSYHSVSGIFRRSSPFNPDGMSLRFEPFTDTTVALETSDVVGVGGGAWVPPTGPPEVEPPLSPTSWELQLPKRLLIAARDKESLLEEIINLKTELHSQTRRFRFQRVHASTVESENRKLEKDIEELELQGLDAPRTGGPDRLRYKLQGMKARLEDFYILCEEQRDELSSLRKDMRLTRTRELEVERDVFAEEVVRLLKLMKRMKAWQNRLSCENKELSNVKDRAILLEIANKRLEGCISAIHKTLEKTKQETAAFKQKALEQSMVAKQDERRLKELEDQAVRLAQQLELEVAEKEKWLKKANKLEIDMRKLAKELRDAEAVAAKIAAAEAAAAAKAAAEKAAAAAKAAAAVAAANAAKAAAKAGKPVAPPPAPVNEKPKAQQVKKVNDPTTIKPVHGGKLDASIQADISRQPGKKEVDKSSVASNSSRTDSSRSDASKSISWARDSKKKKVASDKRKSQAPSHIPKLSFVQIKPGSEGGLAAQRFSMHEDALYGQKGKGAATIQRAFSQVAGKTDDEAKRKAAAQKEEARRKAELKAKEEEARKKAAAEEEARKKAAAEEDARKKAAANEDARKTEEEARKKAAADEEARKKAAAEGEAQKKAAAEDEAQKMAEELRRKQAEEEAKKRKEAEEAAKLKQEEDERKRKEGMDADELRKTELAAKMKAEEDRKAKEMSEQMKTGTSKEDEDVIANDEQRKKGEEERKKKEEEERKRMEEEELKKKEVEEERKRKEQEDAKKKQQEEDRKKKEEDDRKRNEEAQKRTQDEELRRDEEKKKREAERKLKEEGDRKAKEEADKMKAEEDERKKKAGERPLGERKSVFEDYTKSKDAEAEARMEKMIRGDLAAGRSASFAQRRALRAKEAGFAEDTRQIVEKDMLKPRASVGFYLQSDSSSGEASTSSARNVQKRSGQAAAAAAIVKSSDLLR